MSLFKKLFAGKDARSTKRIHDLSEGDVFYTQWDDRYHMYKLLVVDKAMDGYHVLAYQPAHTLPDQKTVAALKVAVYHLPIARQSFTDAVFLASSRVTAEELTGYHEYLRQTQSPDYYIPIANQYYQAGLRLTNEKKHAEAIDAYSKAVDLIPSFFEATDNRAFCKMDLALWTDAIDDFRASLAVHPNSLLAEFSIGECYLQLGHYQQAKAQFEKAHQLDPAHEAPKEFLKKVNALLGKSV